MEPAKAFEPIKVETGARRPLINSENRMAGLAGSALMFHSGTMEFSDPNHSTAYRWLFGAANYGMGTAGLLETAGGRLAKAAAPLEVVTAPIFATRAFADSYEHFEQGDKYHGTLSGIEGTSLTSLSVAAAAQLRGLTTIAKFGSRAGLIGLCVAGAAYDIEKGMECYQVHRETESILNNLAASEEQSNRPDIGGGFMTYQKTPFDKREPNINMFRHLVTALSELKYNNKISAELFEDPTKDAAAVNKAIDARITELANKRLELIGSLPDISVGTTWYRNPLFHWTSSLDRVNLREAASMDNGTLNRVIAEAAYENWLTSPYNTQWAQKETEKDTKELSAIKTINETIASLKAGKIEFSGENGEKTFEVVRGSSTVSVPTYLTMVDDHKKTKELAAKTLPDIEKLQQATDILRASTDVDKLRKVYLASNLPINWTEFNNAENDYRSRLAVYEADKTNPLAQHDKLVTEIQMIQEFQKINAAISPEISAQIARDLQELQTPNMVKFLLAPATEKIMDKELAALSAAAERFDTTQQALSVSQAAHPEFDDPERLKQMLKTSQNPKEIIENYKKHASLLTDFQVAGTDLFTSQRAVKEQAEYLQQNNELKIEGMGDVAVSRPARNLFTRDIFAQGQPALSGGRLAFTRANSQVGGAYEDVEGLRGMDIFMPFDRQMNVTTEKMSFLSFTGSESQLRHLMKDLRDMGLNAGVSLANTTPAKSQWDRFGFKEQDDNGALAFDAQRALQSSGSREPDAQTQPEGGKLDLSKLIFKDRLASDPTPKKYVITMTHRDLERAMVMLNMQRRSMTEDGLVPLPSGAGISFSADQSQEPSLRELTIPEPLKSRQPTLKK